MVWNCKPSSSRVAQDDMTSGLMIDRVANFTECLDCIRARTNRHGSHGDFDNSLSDGARNWFTMLLQAFDVALNGVTYIHHCFVTSFPLRDAARQSRAFSDKYAVFVWFNRDAKFHVASLPIAAAVRNVTLCG